MQHELTEKLLAQDRAALARSITLAESTRADHQDEAAALIADILPYTGKSLRLGITGTPGVGKSTFIEAFGMHAIAQGHRVAVLAIDPSSARTGGSILGDKTRMQELSQHESAFIRPSPSSGKLGGVAWRTREALLLCEAAGYDIIIVETVGVGQSETDVADMTDLFMLLLQPGAGDELQGIKRGIVELADMLVVTKADGDLAAQARRVQSDYSAAIRMLTPHGMPLPPVLACSALSQTGVAEVYGQVLMSLSEREKNGSLQARRSAQARIWMWKEIRERVMDAFLSQPGLSERAAELEAQVSAMRLSPSQAARELVG